MSIYYTRFVIIKIDSKCNKLIQLCSAKTAKSILKSSSSLINTTPSPVPYPPKTQWFGRIDRSKDPSPLIETVYLNPTLVSLSGQVEYSFSLIEIRAELNIFQACIFDFFLFDFNTNNDGTDLDLGTLISFNKTCIIVERSKILKYGFWIECQKYLQL